MADPVKLKKLLVARQAARSIDAAGLTQAEYLFGDEGAVVGGWRVLRRNDDTSDQNHNGLGIILFDADGPCSQKGTANRQALTHWLSGHPVSANLTDPEATFFGDSVATDGKAEIELSVHRIIDSQSRAVWVNAVTGQINNELTVIVDGEVVGVNTSADVQGTTAPFPPQ